MPWSSSVAAAESFSPGLGGKMLTVAFPGGACLPRVSQPGAASGVESVCSSTSYPASGSDMNFPKLCAAASKAAPKCSWAVLQTLQLFTTAFGC